MSKKNERITDVASQPYPTTFDGTLREWKTRKRGELARLRQAMQGIRWGCGHTPAYHELQKIDALIEEAQQKLSVKEWGR